jgi:hypothetical protein
MNPVEISADQFRRLAERVTKLVAEYLENIDTQSISPATDGAETLACSAAKCPSRESVKKLSICCRR